MIGRNEYSRGLKIKMFIRRRIRRLICSLRGHRRLYAIFNQHEILSVMEYCGRCKKILFYKDLSEAPHIIKWKIPKINFEELL